MKKILLITGVFILCASPAFASDFCASGFGMDGANGTYSPSGTYNGQTEYMNSNGWYSFLPTNGNGWYMNDSVTEAYADYYSNVIQTNPWLNDPWLVASGVSPAGIIVTGDCVLPPTAPTGISGVIDTASTTFSNQLNMNWSDVTNYLQSMMLLVMGTGLGILALIFPYIVGVALISSVVFFTWRAITWSRRL